MKITFHGAAQTVTGSKHLIETDSGKKILLECGMFQGHGTDTDRLNRHLGFNPHELDAVVISHAHIDHSGLLPLLVKQGYSGPIFCTPATRDLMEIMLLDSGSIQESDIRFLNKRRTRKGKPALKPLYVPEDVPQVLEQIRVVEYGEPEEIIPDCTLLLTDVGHIVGSAAIHLTFKEGNSLRRLFFTGDIGRYNHELLQDPVPFPPADIILCESTYGNQLHESDQEHDEKLLQHIRNTCLDKGGKLIIPAFSVGRTQELLFKLNRFYLQGRLPEIPYYVDSPLSEKATRITRDYMHLYNKRFKLVLSRDQDPFAFPGLVFIKDAEESKALNYSDAPCVIISASGMADAGRVKHHIANNIGKKESTILLVGYCEPSSLGGRLLSGAREVRIFGEEYHVNCAIESIRNLSAHGDYEDIFRYLSCQNPASVERIFLVHGDKIVMESFRTYLHKKGFKKIDIPERHETIQL
jgi:metallo-beta-lactamase family protein